MSDTPEITLKNPVAYFSAEFGLEAKLPIYAGGLGVLSGDTVKAAADAAFPMVAVGLLYQGEGAVQELDEDGRQTDKNWDFEPLEVGLEHVEMDGMPLFIKVHLTQIDVWCQCWKKTLANGVILYLLDTNVTQNFKSERIITNALYNGTEESLVKQQMILGIGGVKMLHAIGIHPRIYHLNEGRPALLHWQLIRSYMDTHDMSYEDAQKMAKAKTVYTNHTLVAAGNQSYSIHLLRNYGQYYAEKMGIGVDELLAPGMEHSSELFNMTRFALNVSRKANGVSELHSKLSAENWPEYSWCNVTNGVHMPTWQDQEIKGCNMDGDDLWHLHLKKKRETMEFVLKQTGFGYNPDWLVITWARRMATYKRFNDMFDDLNRFAAILKRQDRPVMLLMAGKAHCMDTQAKLLLQEVIHFMQNELAGHAIFVPNYNIDIAKMLVKGSDIWLNTPSYGEEACGTSGMKAISNGVLQCSVKDGWVWEIDWAGMGWIIDYKSLASSLYNLLENDIVPLYYDRDGNGIPRDWLLRMKRSIKLSEKFSAERMLREYDEKLYKGED